jgi:CelD/BcsL family acetyltransferase involved in cellulose biosynthesis
MFVVGKIGMKDIEFITPLEDPRWSRFVDLHPKASIFHTREWMAALKKTYGYSPFVIAMISQSGEIGAAIPVCAVESWLTGKRLISLPFADHCEPLVHSSSEMLDLMAALEVISREGKYNYVELRPLSNSFGEENSGLHACESASYSHHVVDLRPNIPELFGRLHASCVRRKIRRAEQQRLAYESGRSEEMVQRFYRLMVMTRRRHSLFPQPIVWFQNLAREFGEKLTVHLAREADDTVAGIITIQHGDKLVYKYGASDETRHALGGMPFLFWNAMLRGKSAGATEFDLGRTDDENRTLSTFKERLGADSERLRYFCLPPSRRPKSQLRVRGFVRFFTHLPGPFCCAAGKLLYRHAA